MKLRHQTVLVAIGAILLSSGAAAAWQGAPGEGDKAYVPPVVAEPPLPALPPRPTLDTDSYPACREDYRKKKEPFDQAEAINRCTVAIDAYYRDKMLPYRQAMIAEGHTHPLPRHGNVGQRFFRFRLGLLCSGGRMRPILPGKGREAC